MTLTQHILACTDFSEASNLAVEAAAVLAQQNQAKVTLVHVFDPRPLGNHYPLAYADSGAQQLTSEAEVEEEIHEALGKLAEEKLHGLQAKTAVVLSGNAAEGIVHYAEKEDVDMIVVATHGRSGLSHMLIGSVAERVVRHAPCPVLALRSQQTE